MIDQTQVESVDRESYLKHIRESQIDSRQPEPEYGEIFIANKQSKGAIESIPESKGKQILSISGGKRKVYLFEEVNEEEHIVTAVHPESEDFLEYEGQQVISIDQVIQSMEGRKISTIKCGAEHNIILTVDGSLFSFGKNAFGSLGLGGQIFAPSPKPIKKLSNRKIVSVACGLHHSLALSETGDVYSWGRGFEGQLGLLKEMETASSPQYISHFYKYDKTQETKMLKKNPIKYIACGASHSMAIDLQGIVYCWGEARFGQTGNGKKTKEPVPVAIKLIKQNEQVKASKIEGGLGHTLCLSTDGHLFSWGLNIKGQLGIGDLPENVKSPNNDSIEYVKASYYPIALEKSRQKQALPIFKDIACGFCRSFAIDEDGNAWCWGGGALGFKDKNSQRSPTKLTQNTENRKFTKLFANEDSLVLFSQLRLLFFKPALAPSKGSTEMTFFGNGFTETGMQSARFSVNNEIIDEVEVNYDQKSSTFFCKTPNFEKINKTLKYPVECQIDIGLDRQKYYRYEKKLMVYSSKLSMESCDPKVGSAQGIGNVQIYIPLKDELVEYIESITVGFKNNSKTEEESRMQDWICSEGSYSENKITCKLPNIPNFSNESPFYLMDISLNGQQFTQYPQTFRYYWISETSLSPNQCPYEGEIDVVLSGKGLFDTSSKELRLDLNFTYNDQNYDCSREVQATWNKVDKNFTFRMPSLNWMIGDHQITPELLEEASKSPVVARLYLSKQNPIEIGKFRFVAPPPPEQPEEDKKDSKKDAKKGAKK